jgi:uncharacterized protein with NAD-binding domain and iron-sulfur cluster
MSQNSTELSVAIAGGGLAGLAAACALADSGFRVSLFERRPYLGFFASVQTWSSSTAASAWKTKSAGMT